MPFHGHAFPTFAEHMILSQTTPSSKLNNACLIGRFPNNGLWNTYFLWQNTNMLIKAIFSPFFKESDFFRMVWNHASLEFCVRYSFVVLEGLLVEFQSRGGWKLHCSALWVWDNLHELVDGGDRWPCAIQFWIINQIELKLNRISPNELKVGSSL